VPAAAPLQVRVEERREPEGEAKRHERSAHFTRAETEAAVVDHVRRGARHGVGRGRIASGGVRHVADVEGEEL